MCKGSGRGDFKSMKIFHNEVKKKNKTKKISQNLGLLHRPQFEANSSTPLVQNLTRAICTPISPHSLTECSDF